jgi:hypothetical protein
MKNPQPTYLKLWVIFISVTFLVYQIGGASW